MSSFTMFFTTTCRSFTRFTRSYTRFFTNNRSGNFFLELHEFLRNTSPELVRSFFTYFVHTLFIRVPLSLTLLDKL